MRPSTSLLHQRQLTFRALPRLADSSVGTFQQHAFVPERPHLFPRGAFAYLPAIQEWFERPRDAQREDAPWRLRTEALMPYGETLVLTEYLFSSSAAAGAGPSFSRGEAPLSLFLTWLAEQKSTLPSSSFATAPNPQLTIAQASLSHLPPPMQFQVPTPEIVLKAGNGDIYDSSLWLGLAPTITPLHRDPNPNVLVHLAGRKRIRLFGPEVGARLRSAFDVGREGSADMMVGKGRDALERAVWGDDGSEYRGDRVRRDEELRQLLKPEHDEHAELPQQGCDAQLQSGDAVFIPKGWWHAVRGVGCGVTASVSILVSCFILGSNGWLTELLGSLVQVNWWFR